MDSFNVNGYAIYCRSEKTRYGFRHLAELHQGGCCIAKAKCCYYNRKWESFTYESVIRDVLAKALPEAEAKAVLAEVTKQARGESDRFFKGVAAIASLGSLLCEKPEEQNKFKKRILGTIPGVDFPEDFDRLPEKEKQARLDKAIDTLH